MKFYFKTICLSLILISVFIGFNLINQKENVFADEPESLVCKTKIPIGETIEDTSDLLDDIYVELKNIYDIVPNQIKAAEEMIKAVQNCNLENCQPVCVDISCYSSSLGDEDGLCTPPYKAECVEKECKGKICPDLEFINNLISLQFENIDKSFEKINNIYAEKIKDINDGLEKSREEFDNCSKIKTAETIRCQDVLNKDYEFTVEKNKECENFCEKTGEITPACLECLCGSSINYFCCN